MRRVFLPIAIAALLIAPDVGAQASNDHDEAVRLFLEGKKQRDEHHCELAIAPLEASIAKEESIGAHYNLGVCYEAIDKRKSLDHYNAALKIAKEKKDDREREIRAQLADFLDRTPHIRLALPKAVPSGMKIRVDGQTIPPEYVEAPETIWFAGEDKADYQVAVTAPGYENKSMTVERGGLATIALTRTPTNVTNEGGFRWWHGAGIAAIVVGVGGLAFGITKYALYRNDLGELQQAVDRSEAAAQAAVSNGTAPAGATSGAPCPKTPDGKQQTSVCTQRDFDRTVYSDNEDYARRDGPLWLASTIGGGLLVVAGAVLLVGGSSIFGNSSGSATTANARPTIRFAPTFGPYERGAVLVGTF